MYLTTLLLTSASLLTTSLAQETFQSSSKRGLVFVPSPDHPHDNQIWVSDPTDLTWYYNYKVQPSPAYSNLSQSDFEFVPMLWSPSETFKSEVQTLVNGGTNITHIMAYNEPDGDGATGGSNVDPQTAAENWIAQIEPLRELGIKTGAPAVTGSPRGHTWLQSFFTACADLGTNCTVDFIPVHWYGNFEGLASHLGEVSATYVIFPQFLSLLFRLFHSLQTIADKLSNRYPNISIWITEYALNDASLTDSQYFFKTSAEYFDRLDSVDRYSYFGSFRSDVSNVGPNAAMLTQDGKLTDIGSWYLGGAATGNVPSSKSAKGAAAQETVESWFVGSVALLAGLWML
jgi:hypothetical protein